MPFSGLIKPFLGKCALLTLLCASAFMLVPGVPVFAAKGDLLSVGGQSSSLKKPMRITLGKAEMVDVGGNVSDVMVADPSLIDVQAVQSDRLYVVGLKVGDTNIIVLDDKGDVLKRIDIHVTYDLQAVQALVGELFPKENVKISALHDQILLTGTVSNPDVSSRIANLVGHYVGDLQGESKPVDELVSNLMDVRGEQQVMLQVRIVEATRNVLKELGLKTNANDLNELSTSTIFGNFQAGSSTGRGDSALFRTGAGIALSQEPTGVGRILAESGIRGLGQIELVLNALEEEKLINVLAEPNLTAISGETAGFLAGGEFPVPVGRDQVGNIVIEFRPFGVSLNFKPVVLSESRINMQMKMEVSSLDFSNPVSSGDLVIPGLDVRRADTTVEIPSGGSLMIAGLLQSENLKSMAGLPGISKTPVLGKLVSSEGFKRNETELVVIVTPYLVEPYAEKDRAEHVTNDPVSTKVLPSLSGASSVPVFPQNKPQQRSQKALSGLFMDNVRRIYNLKDSSVFPEDGRFGYLPD
ncbi:MAG: type II and III secretion system protein family protein [Alphaproteobacteria bacterium]|nr:type II and III secretion system protein family protein [Alphaproteobacteria bacterium]